jgi:hypothetical protein
MEKNEREKVARNERREHKRENDDTSKGEV